MDFLESVEKRRTHYGIGKTSPISNEKVRSIVEHAVKHVPSAFNSQGTRVIILFGEHHDKLWDITRESLRKVVPADQFKNTDDKINSFKSGCGTVLFFEDQNVIKKLQEQFELYKDNFPVWAQQSNGMNQYVVWTALQNEGLGASLQHYNEVIEADVSKEWELAANWKLIAQMPFGTPTEQPGAKEFAPIEDRVKVFG